MCIHMLNHLKCHLDCYQRRWHNVHIKKKRYFTAKSICANKCFDSQASSNACSLYRGWFLKKQFMLDGGGRTVWRSFCASDPRQFCFVWEFLHFRGCIDFKVELCRRRRRRVSHGSHYTNWNMITWWGFETADADIEEGESTSNQMKLIFIPSIMLY